MGSDSRPVVSVVICSYNRRSLLRECLTSLFAQTYSKEDYEIIVVDDGSTDGTDAVLQEMASRPGPPLRYFAQENKGSATARNLGIAHAGGEIIASIDDDCVATETWIDNAIPYFADDDVVGVQGQTLPVEPVHLHLFPPRFSYTMQITHATWNRQTCNVFYRRQAIMDVGGFNEDYGMTGAEDADLAFRIEEKGKIVFAAEALVHHAVFYDTLAERLRFMKRYQYEPILFRDYPHLRKSLLLGFIHSREVVHAPFFIMAVVWALLAVILRARLVPSAFLALAWIIVYLWTNVLVDGNLRLYPIRFALFPVKLALHSTKLFYLVVGSIRYRSLII
jgi:glycosyltransferase involved in cell wall biosynthesis